ncbi:hypothetical protein AVEN_237665-1 [Araneus ventricosus]|uniref:Tc1-like transposase DDE domain-containing protein n=1 Tax=Araneus ventricosus TaxID=182803 RepID=A0A4Y2KCR2_ARAVE|nr:hypothetical protein AVEN_237665-1 [Araneus ventricosus]
MSFDSDYSCQREAENMHQAHETMDPECQVGTVQGHSGSIMVWGVFSWQFLGSLVLEPTFLNVIRHIHWPPKSPEMNIIEDIWDALLHAVEKRSPPPRTPMDLLTALKDSWCQLPSEYFKTLVESMPRHIPALLRARGGLT